MHCALQQLAADTYMYSVIYIQTDTCELIPIELSQTVIQDNSCTEEHKVQNKKTSLFIYRITEECRKTISVMHDVPQGKGTTSRLTAGPWQ